MGKIRALINSRVGVNLIIFLFGISIGLNKDTIVSAAGFFLFPIDSEYIFTYDKNFDCSKSGDSRVKTICEFIDRINERISNGKFDTKTLGVFEKSFLEFVRGEKPIKFYSAKNINEAASKKFSGGLNSYYDRLKFYFWSRSERKSMAFAIPIFDRIYLASHFFKNPEPEDNSYTITITHEILHLCWATEEEVRLLGY